MLFTRLPRVSTISRTLMASPFSTSVLRATFKSFLVTPAELSKALKDQQSNPAGPRIIPVSAEWYLPNDPRKGFEEFQKCHIPGSRFFDLDKICDQSSPYPHMLPTKEVFAKGVGQLGITEEDTVVLYDSPHIGLFSAPRAAWTFMVFKHPRVHLLDNFKRWVEQRLVTESGRPESVEAVDYPVRDPDTSIVADFEDILELAQRGKSEGVQILDARPGARWTGENPEPRPEIPSGHVPGSISMPFVELLDPNTKSFKEPAEIRKILEAKGVDMSAKTEKVLMCGTGVTAVVIENALRIAGVEGHRRVYDGSWTEWAQRVDKDNGLIVKGQ